MTSQMPGLVPWLASSQAAAGLGECLMGGVFQEPVEAFDGVAQGGVAGLPAG
ncbi:MAG TPA: hypothetical protein VGS62_05510 [Streptosporangiaceae bacterium]|nr:hypothetical protein [Streptosporangiaceae bacterium]